MEVKESAFKSNSNNKIVKNIIEYIYKTNKIDESILINSTRKYVKILLCEFRNNNYEMMRLEKSFAKKKEQLQSLLSGYVRSENITPSIEGKNTGGRVDKSQLRYIQMGVLREEMEKYLYSILLLEKKINDENELLIEFVKMLTNPTHRMIVMLSYQECMPTAKIAKELNYTENYIWTCRNRSVAKLAEIIEKYINDKN